MRTRDSVLQVIENEWPVSVTHVVMELNKAEKNKFSIQSVKYHFDALAESQKIKTKKIGRNLVAWPSEIEKLRIIHELLKG